MSKEEGKEMKLADVFKEVTVQSEFETFWNDFGDEIEEFMKSVVQVMQEAAEDGEDYIEADLSELSLGAYQYVSNWLRKEGFIVAENKKYKSNELKGMVSSVTISWENGKAKETKKEEGKVTSPAFKAKNPCDLLYEGTAECALSSELNAVPYINANTTVKANILGSCVSW